MPTRHPIKVLVVNESNPDDVRSFPSMASAAKALQITHHSTLRKALDKGHSLNGFKVSIVSDSQQSINDSNVSATIHKELTLWDEVDDLFKGAKIRYTTDEPVKISVFDIIKVVTGIQNPRDNYAHLQQTNAEFVGRFYKYHFSGQGERPTPVCTVPQMIELINILPGQRAARFRQAGAKVLVRVLGGDETLVDEIRENATRITESQQANPMSMFKLPEGLTGVNAVCSVMLSPSMHGKTVADFRKGPCTYMILFRYKDQVAIKFGWTKNLTERVKEHKRLYPDMKIWCAMGTKFSECAEETEKLFKGKMSAYLHTIQLETKDGPSKSSTEVLLNVTPEEAEKQMHSALDTVMDETTYHIQQKIELEKVLIAKIHAQNERYKYLLEMHQKGIPDPFLSI